MLTLHHIPHLSRSKLATFAELCKDFIPVFFPDLDPEVTAVILGVWLCAVEVYLATHTAVSIMLRRAQDDIFESTYTGPLTRVGLKVAPMNPSK